MKLDLLLPIALLGTMACDFDASEPLRYSQRLSSAAVSLHTSGSTLDDRFADLAREIPGFAGWWFEGPIAVISLTDTAQALLAKKRVQEWIQESPAARRQAGNPIRFKIVSARYDFIELKQWSDMIRGLLMSGSITFTDIRESSNNLVIGVRTSSELNPTRNTLLQLGVPSDAITMRIEAGAQPVSTVRDSIRPVVGGLQVGRSGIATGCTMTFLARYTGTSTTYYATAAHCTLNWGWVDGETWYQNVYNVGPIGSEYVEGDSFYCQMSVCTYGDIALIGPASSGAYTFGRIAKTMYAGPDSGSLTIDTNLPNGFEIVGEESWPVEGQYVDKMGRTTGWTTGSIDESCTNYRWGAWIQLCTYKATAGADDGDSGSPVFGFDSATKVIVFGIAWGKNGSGDVLFHSMGGIELALGEIDIY